MSSIERSIPARSRGFSLLELLVAIAILGLALGALYQASAGAVRNVQVDERHAYAVELARSLLAENQQVPARGRDVSGKTPGGFDWRVTTRALPLGRSYERDAMLQRIRIEVSWTDAGKRREVSLDSVVEGGNG